MKLKVRKILFSCLVVFFSCKVEKQKKSTIKSIQKIDTPFFCNSDSITVDFLVRKKYKEALKNCKFTILERNFVLGAYGVMGPRKLLHKHFSEEEYKSKKIVIKEVIWETKDSKDFIQVWYRKDNINWFPVEAYKYSKSTQF